LAKASSLIIFYAAKSFIAAVTLNLIALLEILIIFSSLFLGYGIAYFTTTNMKSEFIRFGLGLVLLQF
jgi:hypothetical protein